MKTPVIAALLLLVSAAAFAQPRVTCNASDYYTQLREDTRDRIRNYGSIHFVVGFRRIDATLAEETYERALADANASFQNIPRIVQSYKDPTQFQITVASNTGRYFANEVNLSKLPPAVVVTKRFLIGRTCIGKIGDMPIHQLFKQSPKTGCVQMLLVCQVTRTDSFRMYNIERQVLVMTKGEKPLNDTELNKCVKRVSDISIPPFPEFGVDSFCICNELTYYLNDCSSERERESEEQYESIGEHQLVGYSVILGIFMLLFVTIEAFNYLIEDLRE